MVETLKDDVISMRVYSESFAVVPEIPVASTSPLFRLLALLPRHCCACKLRYLGDW